MGTRHWIHRQASRVASAAMQLENDQGEILIVKANYKKYWSLPGGIIDEGETPKQAAIRETLEEVGVDIPADQVEFVAVIDRKSEVADTYQFIFKAPLLADQLSGVILQASEIEAYDIVSRPQVLADKGQRRYGKAIQHWAQDRSGYIEQTFTP